MRSILVVKPDDECLAKAAGANADAYHLDMEDGVPLEKKESVRDFLASRLHQETFLPIIANGAELMLRINGLALESELERDIERLLHPLIRYLIVPMVDKAEELLTVERLIAKRECELGLAKGYFRILPVVETASGVSNASSIAGASDRNFGLILGHNDLVNSLGSRDCSESLVWARQAVVLAARMAGILPIDSPFHEIDRPNGFIRETENARSMGFAGKILIHPSQVELANTIFNPNDRELQWARQIVAADDDGQCTLARKWRGRSFFGPPHVSRAKDYLERSRPQTVEVGPGTMSARLSQGGIDFAQVKTGEINYTSMEITIGQGWSDLWDASFFNIQRLFTSSEFAQSLGFADRLIPYSLLMTLTGGMSVSQFSESGLFHLGLSKIRYISAVYANDTLRNGFSIVSVRPSARRSGSIVESDHFLQNQDGKIVFRFRKQTLFPPEISELVRDARSLPDTESEGTIRDVLSSQSRIDSVSCGLLSKNFLQSSLLIHRLVKTFEGSETRQLATLLRLTNPHHYDDQHLSADDLVVPGPFLISATLSLALSDFGDVIDQEIQDCANINVVNYQDTLAAISYVVRIEDSENIPGLEVLTVVTLGIINFDVRLLSGREIPLSLFSEERMKPSELEMICKSAFSVFHHRIACWSRRKIWRAKV